MLRSPKIKLRLETKYPKKFFKNSFDEIITIPSSSGLYYFYDDSGKLLYVGLAKTLKSRIKDHRKLNNLEREGKFYSKLQQKKYSPENQKRLEAKIDEFRYKCMTSITSLAIDRIFHKVSRIEVQEMPYPVAERMEFEMINSLKPPFNWESGSDEYDELMSQWL